MCGLTPAISPKLGCEILLRESVNLLLIIVNILMHRSMFQEASEVRKDHPQQSLQLGRQTEESLDNCLSLRM